ncbi:MAG TPA: hypothetical protein VJT33_17705 [bacterium]|nr:hypothetical protein [bacterium]
MIAQLQAWQNFYTLIGSAAATLAGLMFIAISLGATRRPTAQERSMAQLAYNVFLSPTYIHFVYVLVTAVVVSVPTLNETVFGVMLILTGAGSLGYTLRHLPFVRGRYRTGALDRSDLVWYELMPSICYVLYVDAGIGLLRAAAGAPSRGHALDALATSSILLMVIGVRNAWDLMVFQVMRAYGAPGDDPPKGPGQS